VACPIFSPKRKQHRPVELHHFIEAGDPQALGAAQVFGKDAFLATPNRPRWRKPLIKPGKNGD